MNFANLCRPRTAAIGLVALALIVGSCESPAAEECPKGVVCVKLSGKETRGNQDAIRNVADCARVAKLPPPPPCTALPCGWVMNVSCWDRSAYPCWKTMCQVPVGERSRR